MFWKDEKMELILENIRCFFGKHKLPIRPLTFLVGENSTGKTTAMAMLSAVTSPETYQISPKFNSPPYDLGGFSSIACNPGRKAGRVKNFVIGVDTGNAEKQVGVSCVFTEASGQPALTDLLFIEGKQRLQCSIDPLKKKIAVTMAGSSDNKKVPDKHLNVPPPPPLPASMSILQMLVYSLTQNEAKGEEAKIQKSALGILGVFFRFTQ